MEKAKIDRINELARKKKTAGLTEAELTEQAALRKQYLEEFRASMQATLDNTYIRETDGSTHPLEKKKAR